MSRHPARSILMLVSSDPLSQIRLVMFLGDSLTRGFDPSNDTYPAWTLYMLLPNSLGNSSDQCRGKWYVRLVCALLISRIQHQDVHHFRDKADVRMIRVLPDIHSQCQAQSLQPGLVTI